MPAKGPRASAIAIIFAYLHIARGLSTPIATDTMQREPDWDNHLMDRSFIDASIPQLVKRMTGDEKRELLTADAWWHTSPIPRLNIPSIKVTDGPNGARGGNAYKMTPAVCFPNATCVAATFDADLTHRMGQALAKETKARNALCLLAPTINIARSPLGGRAFESFSEDPTLSGLLASKYIAGLQQEGVSPCLKHFICNDQEHDRVGQNAVVQSRALREIYMRPFQMCMARSKPWSIMSSYNRVNGVHVSENPFFLQKVLREEWQFDGIVISDWFGTYSLSEAINAGLHLEFPGPTRWRHKDIFDHTLSAHKMHQEQVDRLVAETLLWIQKLVKGNPELVYGKDKTEITRWDEKEADSKLVKEMVTAGTVLLKNDDSMLPIEKGSVAVIGPNAKAKVFTGGGSARLQPAWSSTPWQGLSATKPDNIDLSYALGTSTAKYFPLLDDCFTNTQTGEVGFEAYHYPIQADGTMAEKHVAADHLYRSEIRYNNFTRPGLGADFFTEVKTTFQSPITGDYDLEITATGKWWLWIDNKLVKEYTEYTEKGTAFYGNGCKEQLIRMNVSEGQKYNIRLLHDTRAPPNVTYLMSATFRYPGIRIGAQPAYDAETSMNEAVELAKTVDKVIIVCGLTQDWESEGDDRPNLDMPLRTNELIGKVAAANSNIAVVIQGGSALAMPWLNDVKSVLQIWYGGNESGTGLADIVYGRVNPSGRLPLTFPKREQDIPAALSFKSANYQTYYEEGIWVGYKHYVARGIEPLFPFGFGLSYTTFDYSNLEITSVKVDDSSSLEIQVQVDVTNSGNRAGSHSVHFYVCPPAETSTGLRHPAHTLQAFDKVHELGSGSTATASVRMDKYAVSHWDEMAEIWRIEPGTWTVRVGRSAHDLYGEAQFRIGEGLSWRGI